MGILEKSWIFVSKRVGTLPECPPVSLPSRVLANEEILRNIIRISWKEGGLLPPSAHPWLCLWLGGPYACFISSIALAKQHPTKTFCKLRLLPKTEDYLFMEEF